VRQINIDSNVVKVESCYDCPVYLTTGSDCDIYVCRHPLTKDREIEFLKRGQFPDFCPLTEVTTVGNDH